MHTTVYQLFLRFIKLTDLVKMDNDIKEGNYKIRIYSKKERRGRVDVIEHIIFIVMQISLKLSAINTPRER